jgi:hypothetical protein
MGGDGELDQVVVAFIRPIGLPALRVQACEIPETARRGLPPARGRSPLAGDLRRCARPDRLLRIVPDRQGRIGETMGCRPSSRLMATIEKYDGVLVFNATETMIDWSRTDNPYTRRA